MLLISASSLTKRIFQHLQTDTKLSPTYEYSPEHAASSFSEGESLLHKAQETLAPISPIFTRIPLEDRSKYEKLTGSQDDLSSDAGSDHGLETHHRNEKIKKKKNLKSIPRVDLPRVKNLISKDRHVKNSQNQQNKSVEYESDDSIGSASDLRANDDAPEIENKIKKADEISETISESIHTCSSSAYHAECESMATKEDDCTSRMIRMKKAELQQPPQLTEDMLFVGHQYGEKPLLLDDELDSDCELKLENSIWSVEKKNQPQEIWTISKRYDDCLDEDDVFASAPFQKIPPKQKKKTETNITEIASVAEEISNELPVLHEDTPKASRDHSPLLILTPPNPTVTECGFEDDTVAVSNLNPFVNQVTSTPKVIQSTSNYGVVTVNNHIVNIEIPNSSQKNLFGIKNFDAFTPFSQNDNFISPEKFQPSYFTTQTVPSQIIYENITIPHLPPKQNDNSCQESFAFTGKVTEFPKLDNDVGKFDVIGKSNLNNFSSSPFDSQPGSCETANNVSKTESSDNFIPAFVNSKDKLQFFSNDVEDESTFYRESSDYHSQDNKKDKKGKSKYQLIETDLSDDKNASKASRSGKANMGYKKVSSKNKKISSKLPKMPVGFSNMSFEDFPSDESEQVNNYSSPFEVVRKSYDEERRYGSLKRRSNPFS